MSVTFFMPNKQEQVEYRNKQFMPNEPEDPVMNPRFIQEPLYPYMNLANSNAAAFLLELGLWDEGDELVGKIPLKELPEFLHKINEMERRFPESSWIGTYFDRLDKLVRAAISLNEDICWA